MSVRQARLGAVCALAVSALAIAGCGGDDGQSDPSLTPDDARVLNETLDEVTDNVEVGSCVVALEKTQELEEEIGRLPSEVDDEVVEALQRGALSLGELVQDPAQCGEEEEEPATTEETTTDETTTTEDTTTTEETTTTTPTTPTAPTTPTTPTTPAPPPDSGGGISPGDGL